jgi:hypothetical protein
MLYCTGSRCRLTTDKGNESVQLDVLFDGCCSKWRSAGRGEPAQLAEMRGDPCASDPTSCLPPPAAEHSAETGEDGVREMVPDRARQGAVCFRARGAEGLARQLRCMRAEKFILSFYNLI